MKKNSLKHHLLIAMPKLTDTYFGKSVVFLYEHSSEGAMGILVNKPLQIELGSVMQHLKIEDIDKDVAKAPVYMGGPVGQDHGFIIQEIEKTEKKATLQVSASKETLGKIAHGVGPKNFLVALGYAGWDANQLETELARNDWLLAPYSRKILFDTPIEKRWSQAAKLIGIDINHLSNQVGHA